MGKYSHQFLVIICLIFTFSASSAKELAAIDLSSHTSGDSTVDQYQYYIQDFTEQLELLDVLQITDWIQPEPGEVTHGFSDYPSWMKFSVVNSTESLQEIVVEYVDASVETIDFYYREQGSKLKFEHLNYTFNKPVTTRPVAFYRPAFPLHIPAEKTYEIYVRIFQGNDFPMHSFTSMRIWEEKSFYLAGDQEMLLLLILLCTGFFMCVLTSIAFAITRDDVFLYYACFAFSAFLLFSGLSGLWGYFIARNGFELWMVVLQISLCQIAAVLFVRRFLNIKKNLPRVDTLLLVMVWVDVIGVILNLTGTPYFSRIIIDYTAFAYLFLLPIGIHAYIKKVPHALLFTSSWIIFIVGMALAALRYRGYIADSFWAEWMIYFGGYIEVLLLTTVMALRLRDAFREKKAMEYNHRTFLEKSAQDLSKQVYEKTKLLEKARDTAEEEARTDMLTGLTNRRSFFELAERFIERATHSKHDDLYLLTIDIDNFKKVNDSYGHAAGDAVLAEVASTLQKAVRSVDLLARLGGEEFAVVVASDSFGAIEELSERLRLEVAELQVHFGGQCIPVTISIGVACWAEGMPWHVLMQASDTALYKAKNQGRNRVVHG